eukprot:2345978-Alexandrium_andersonii.AAC.1
MFGQLGSPVTSAGTVWSLIYLAGRPDGRKSTSVDRLFRGLVQSTFAESSAHNGSMLTNTP